MATPSEIAIVRLNIDDKVEPYQYSDEIIESYIDDNGIGTASAIIWGQLAAVYAKSVDVSEAGSSRKFSDLHKHALAMSEFYSPSNGDGGGSPGISTGGRAKVFKIVRS